MRKIFLFVLLVLTSFSLKAQSLDMMSAVEAYNLLLASPQYDSTNVIVTIQAVKIPQMPASELDYTNGKGNLWTVTCKSSDTSQSEAVMYNVLSIAGLPMVQSMQQDIGTDVRLFHTLDTKYLNATGLAAAIAKNTDYMKYKNENEGLFIVELFGLTSSPGTDSVYWMAGAAIADDDSYFCRYEPIKFNLIGCNILKPTGVKDVKQLALNANPNPATDYVKISAPEQGEAKIEFINTLGENVKSLNSNFSGNETISTSDLNSGIYFVKLSINSKVYMQKVSVK